MHYHTLYHTLPYIAIHYHTLLYIIPYITIHDHTLPYITISTIHTDRHACILTFIHSFVDEHCVYTHANFLWTLSPSDPPRLGSQASSHRYLPSLSPHCRNMTQKLLALSVGAKMLLANQDVFLKERSGGLPRSHPVNIDFSTFALWIFSGFLKNSDAWGVCEGCPKTEVFTDGILTSSTCHRAFSPCDVCVSRKPLVNIGPWVFGHPNLPRLGILKTAKRHKSVGPERETWHRCLQDSWHRESRGGIPPVSSGFEQLCDVWYGNHSNQSCSCFREIRSEDVQKPSRLEDYDPSPLPCVNGLIWGKIYRKPGSIYTQLDQGSGFNFPLKQTVYLPHKYKYWCTPPFIMVPQAFIVVKPGFITMKPALIVIKATCSVGLTMFKPPFWCGTVPLPLPPASDSVSAWAAVAAAWRATSHRRLVDQKRRMSDTRSVAIYHMYRRIYIYVYVCLCMYVCMYVCACICICICKCICI